jgi:hypothetical protein
VVQTDQGHLGDDGDGNWKLTRDTQEVVEVDIGQGHLGGDKVKTGQVRQVDGGYGY